MPHRAVITGLGIIAPNGIGKDKYWQSIIAGKSGIRRISRFDTSQFPSHIGGEVLDFNPCEFMEKKKARLLSRFAQFALAATRMSLGDAALQIEKEDLYRVGISMGTSMGGKDVDEEQQKAFFEKGCGSASPLSLPLISSNFAVATIASEYGIRGPNVTLSTGCTSGLNAIAYASDLVANNKADLVIAGGSEAALIPTVFEGFCVAGVLSKKEGAPETLSRPFEKNRDGYILSEGCGIVIIESLEHALQRQAHIYAELAGYGTTNDAYSLVRMEPTGKEVARAIEIALHNADAGPRDIDYVNAHGSSSPLTDKRETNAIKQVFSDHAYKMSVSSIKSMVGQPLAAAGGFQIVSTALSIQEDTIPPTINYEERDPECDLDYTPNYCRKRQINTALVNSFGLGGNNISMVLKKYRN